MSDSGETLATALADLRVLKSKMEQAGDLVPKLTIAEYNAALEHIKSLGQNLDAFKVPETAIGEIKVEVKDSPISPTTVQLTKRGAPSRTVLPLVNKAISHLESVVADDKVGDSPD
jgi:hypothetical protein